MKFINTRIWIRFSFLLALIFGETILMSNIVHPIPTLSQSGQGIAGKIFRLSGDQMPTIDGSAGRKNPEVIQTTVWIFSGRIPASGTKWPILQAQKHPNLIGQIYSDNEGKFFTELPSGEYTLLAQDGSDLYLNAFLGDGSYATVRVEKGQVTPMELVNTENAFF
jgi:hypothetical protein